MRRHVLPGIAALSLVGCSAGGMSSYAAPEDIAGPEPAAYRDVVGFGLSSIIGDPNKAGVMEISRPRRVDSIKGPAWQVCLKTQVYSRPQFYAVFIQNNKVTDSRLAVIADRCPEETYGQFDNWYKEPPLPDDDAPAPKRGGRSGRTR